MTAYDLQGRDVYVDLDSLYDTRLTLLEMLDPLYAMIIYNRGYLTRLEDTFAFIDKKQFQRLWQSRDNEVLEKSSPTCILKWLIEIIEDMLENISNTPNPKVINLYINTWPYEIDKDGMQWIAKPFFDLFSKQVNIHVIRKDPSELPVDYFHKNYSTVIMYDYKRWLENFLSNKKCTEVNLSKVNFVFPKLAISEDIEKDDKIETQDFKNTELLLAPLIGVEFQDVQLYCALFPIKFINERIELLASNNK